MSTTSAVLTVHIPPNDQGEILHDVIGKQHPWFPGMCCTNAFFKRVQAGLAVFEFVFSPTDEADTPLPPESAPG